MFTYTTDQLISFNKHKQRLHPSTWKVCKDLGLVQGTKRGIRSGKCFKINSSVNSNSRLQFESKKVVKESPNSNISFGYVNARSVKNKTYAICDLVFDKKYDVFLITETWLSELGDEVSIKQLTPPGYSFIHCPREGGGSGGVGLLYRSCLNLTQVRNEVNYQSFEHICIRVTLSKETIFVACIYRPPRSKKNKHKDSTFHAEFTDFLDTFVKNNRFIIFGDVNYWYNIKSDSNTKKLISAFESRKLTQLINLPTHKHGNILDWVVLHENFNSFISAVEVNDYMISDHYVISLLTSFSKPQKAKKSILCRNLKGVNFDDFCEDLKNSNLLKNPPRDLNDLTKLYDETLTELIDTHAPLRKKVVVEREDFEFFDSKLREAKRKRRESEFIWRKSGLEVHKQIYREHNNFYTNLLKETHSNYIQNEIKSSGNDPKKTFELVDTLLGKDTSSPVLPNLDEKSASQKISNYFVEKIDIISSDLEEAASQLPSSAREEAEPSGTSLHVFQPVNEESLRKIIVRSKKTSCYLDPIPTKFLLKFLDIVLPIILLIINKSLESGYVPESFKKAIVKPLLKKTNLDPLVCKNYRPVSNLSYLSKLLERVVAEQLISHFDINNYLDKFQSAYRTGYSTETALLKVLNDSLVSINSGNLVLLVLLDLSAAFDTINHTLLLQRLTSIAGIKDTALQWFASYLSGRSQTVLVGSSFSESSELTCGVPQGSVLGPILFSLYTSDLGKLIESFDIGRQFFADDSQLINSISPEPEVIEAAVRNLESCCLEIKKWMLQNRLKLNDEKTEVIVFGPKEKVKSVDLNSIRVGDAIIPVAEKVRNLGLILDTELLMTEHINHIVKNCYFHLRRLGKIRKFITKEAANAIAIATVGSRLDYCNSCFWGLPAYEIERLQKIQNIAARIVSGTKKRDHITPVLRELHWLPVKQRITYKVLCMTYSCIHGGGPEYLREIIPQYVPSRSLRSSSQLRLRLPSVDDTNKNRFGGRSFANAAPQLWNSLPTYLKEAENINSFRRKLKTFLF